MIVLDAYVVLAYVKRERAAAEARALLRRPDRALTSVGVAEVVDHLVRVVAIDVEDVMLTLARIDVLDGVGVSSAVGASAGRLRARHYHRTTCVVSLADCVAAEVARARSAALATADPHLLDVCHREGIAVQVLPGSDGSRWLAPSA